MREAGVDLVTLGVFSWAFLQPAPDRWDFGWLDEQMDELHAAGIRVDLATATASPPPWLTHQHPEILPVTQDGRTLWPGGRQAYCPSSPVFREHALALCRAMAERYADHPALALWHVSNELGCHNARCYCDVSAAAFRDWLRRALRRRRRPPQRRLGHRLLVPALRRLRAGAAAARRAPAYANPTQQLDFPRFSSDQLLDNFVAERDVLHEVSPGVPVTTNFMVMRHTVEMDYLALGPRARRRLQRPLPDRAEDPHGHRELAFSADLTRGTAGGRPVAPDGALHERGQLAAAQPSPSARARCSATAWPHVARGADAVLFFQWRASRAGRGEVPLRPAAARRHRHPPLARGRASSSRAPRRDRGGRRQRAAQRGGDPLRLGGVVGLRARLPPQHRRALPRPRRGPPPGAHGARRRRGRRAPERRPVVVRPGRGADALPRHRRGRRRDRGRGRARRDRRW